MRIKIIPGLTEEQCVKYQTAIRQGLFAGYDREWRARSFANAFIWKYPNRMKTINVLTEICKRTPEWEDITDINLMYLADYFEDTLAPLSVRTYLAEVRSVLQDFHMSVQVPSRNYERILSHKGDVSQAIYLNETELDAFMKYKPQTDTEMFVKRSFLIECFVGCRWNEAVKIDDSNYIKERNIIRYYSSKARRDIVVPCHDHIYQYIVNHDLYSKTRRVGLDQYNRILRDICFACGFREVISLHKRGIDITDEKWKFVTSHTGRRSFATNLYLKNIQIDTICQLMGHSSVVITKRYIVAERPLDNDVLRAFRAYDGNTVQGAAPADTERQRPNDIIQVYG